VTITVTYIRHAVRSRAQPVSTLPHPQLSPARRGTLFAARPSIVLAFKVIKIAFIFRNNRRPARIYFGGQFISRM